MITPLKSITSKINKKPNPIITVEGNISDMITLQAELLSDLVTTPVVFYNTELKSYYYWNSTKFINGAGLIIKSGLQPNANFSGNPKKSATINFTFPFPNNDYSITLGDETTSNGNYNMSVESKTATGFIINAGSNNINKLVNILWIAVENGEN